MAFLMTLQKPIGNDALNIGKVDVVYAGMRLIFGTSWQKNIGLLYQTLG